MIVLFGLVAVVFLYIGMIGMDKSNKRNSIIYMERW